MINILKQFIFRLIMAATIGTLALARVPVASSLQQLDIWWPSSNVTVSGSQPFKAMLQGSSIENYQMYWQVEGGQLNVMHNNYTDYPHKEVSVDLTGWTWKGTGPYTLNFVAKDWSGNTIGQQTSSIYLKRNTAPAITASVSVSFPAQNATLNGTQSLKARADGLSLDKYKMYWQVDGANLNEMQNASDYKESLVDFTGWTWKGSGPYTLNFVAKDLSGKTINQKAINIFTGQVVAPTVSPTPTVTLTPAAPTSTSTNILKGMKLWVNPNSDPAKYITRTDISETDRALMKKLALGAETQWFSKNWISNMYEAINNYVTTAAASGAIPVMVIYDIPYRDNGNYSAGGANDPATYKATVDQFANAIGNRKAAVIVEPDALTLLDGLSWDKQQERLALLKYAVQKFKSNSNTAVYLDIGHARWKSVDQAASLLQQSGVEFADGFSLNVSNFVADDESVTYGTNIANTLATKYGVKDKRFVIDRGRNGNGTNGEWCNPYGRALGKLPTTDTGNASVDAFLWVKGPSGSDGYCNNGPAAGQFFPSYALDLARNTSW